jgi:hypothetical protein
MRTLQEERTPFVEHQHFAPVGAQSNTNRQSENPYMYDGPLELQGSGKPEPVHLDGFTAAVRLRNNSVDGKMY